ncbi:putative antigen [Dirofilaria immitis]
MNQMSEPAVPLVLSRITIATTYHSRVKLTCEKLSFPGSCPSRRIYRQRNASWYRLRSELGRYLIAFEPLTFVLD